MKAIKLLSLFFYLVMLGCCIIPKHLCAQQAIDSSWYHYNKALNPTNNKDLANSYLFYKDDIEQSLKKHDTLSVIQSIRMLAIIEYDLGLLENSEKTSVSGLKLLDNLKDTPESRAAKVGFYNQLGKIYRGLDNQNTALYYYDKALSFSTKLKDSLILYNNKGNIYSDLNKYNKAIDYFSKSYQKGLKLQDTILIARALDNLGFAQSKMAIPEGIINLEKALSSRLEIGDTKGLYASLKHLSDYYKIQKNKPLAITYAERAYKIAQEINSSSFIEDALSRLLELHDDETIVQYVKLKDSITGSKNKIQNRYVSMKYNFVKEKRRADKNELLSEKEKRRAQIFLLLGISTFLLGTLLILYLRARHKREKLLQVYNTETRISKKIHDEVANDMYHVISKIQSEDYNILDNLESIYNKTRDISRENNTIDLKENFNDCLYDMLLSFRNDNTVVITQNFNKVNWKQLSEIKKNTIYRVLQELMINMKKHSNATHVVLKFNKEGNKLAIYYKDNGKGCTLKKTGGLLNMENRIKTINGTIIFDSTINNGFQASIKM
ncbi:tetratricopeptide repeat-containing sensor histidine kinase [Flavobacterium litorale]|uniref:histidine kinase n=1 Tax=Flavobacterium litorale TaxID=2856519 RepID=A0ABX8VB48_9FLAO|nr:tetratricopeptide repeat-containing sensor histidine kinase [Flavobacterium litorale]QYJ68256.1 ATP-binding protein [Flavobacterium litorale]